MKTQKNTITIKLKYDRGGIDLVEWDLKMDKPIERRNVMFLFSSFIGKLVNSWEDE